jgi:hypothetical protein
MLVVGSALSTPLAAQSAFALGVAATVGGSWQIEAVDLGVVRSIHAGPLRSVSVGGRFGAFIDEGALIGGARGFVAALVLQTRTGLLQLADVGNETNPSSFGLDLSFEGVAYGAANTPLSQQFGSAWVGLSVLPGVRFGDAHTLRAGLVFGPTLFIGPTTEVRPFLALRFELPMVHHKRQP